jgi:hypothetical protein
MHGIIFVKLFPKILRLVSVVYNAYFIFSLATFARNVVRSDKHCSQLRSNVLRNACSPVFAFGQYNCVCANLCHTSQRNVQRHASPITRTTPTVLYCTVLYHTIVYCTVMVLYNTVLYYIISYYSIPYCTDTILYYTILL